MPQYADQLQSELSGLKSWLAGMGVTQADVQNMFKSIDKSSIVAFAAALLSSVTSVFTSLLFIITLLIFLAVDGGVFGERMVKQPSRSRTGPSPLWAPSPPAPASTSA